MPVNCCIASRNEIISFLFTFTWTFSIFALSFACDLQRKHNSSFFFSMLLQNLRFWMKIHRKFDEKTRYTETNRRQWQNYTKYTTAIEGFVLDGFFSPSFDNCEMSNNAYSGVGSYVERLSDVVFNVWVVVCSFFRNSSKILYNSREKHEKNA